MFCDSFLAARVDDSLRAAPERMGLSDMFGSWDRAASRTTDCFYRFDAFGFLGPDCDVSRVVQGIRVSHLLLGGGGRAGLATMFPWRLRPDRAGSFSPLSRTSAVELARFVGGVGDCRKLRGRGWFRSGGHFLLDGRVMPYLDRALVSQRWSRGCTGYGWREGARRWWERAS
jgi:hypothetical protein